MKILIIIAILTFNIYAAPKCVAHRGFPAAALENSLRAIKEAVKIKADVVEFDVHLTKDGIPLLMHDKRLRRTVQSRKNKNCTLFFKRIKALNYSQIQENCELKNGEDIPTLEATLSYLSDKNIEVMIELKDQPNKNILELIEKNYINNLEKIKILSNTKKRIENFNDLDKNNIFEDIEFFKTDLIPLKTDKDYNASYWNAMISHKIINKLPDHRKVYVWTIDSEDKIQKFMDMNVDYIGSNRVDLCLKIKAQQDR